MLASDEGDEDGGSSGEEDTGEEEDLDHGFEYGSHTTEDL